jgi:hypothetical protein
MATLSAERPPATASVSDAAVDELQQYRRVSLAAMASVGLGLVGLFAFVLPGMLIFPAIGLLCAIIAFVNIRRYEGELSGTGLAALGAVASLLLLIGATSYHAYIYATEVPDGYQRITFYEFEPPSDAPPSQLISDDAIALDGKKVFIKGYVHPSVDSHDRVKRFVLVPDMGTCCFGGVPKLTDMIAVELAEGESTKYNMRLRKLAGTFHVNRQIEPVAGIQGVGPGVAFELSPATLE